MNCRKINNEILKKQIKKYGKSIEYSISKTDVKIETNRKKYLKWSFRSVFKRKYNLIID